MLSIQWMLMGCDSLIKPLGSSELQKSYIFHFPWVSFPWDVLSFFGQNSSHQLIWGQPPPIFYLCQPKQNGFYKFRDILHSQFVTSSKRVIQSFVAALLTHVFIKFIFHPLTNSVTQMLYNALWMCWWRRTWHVLSVPVKGRVLMSRKPGFCLQVWRTIKSSLVLKDISA